MLTRICLSLSLVGLLLSPPSTLNSVAIICVSVSMLVQTAAAMCERCPESEEDG